MMTNCKVKNVDLSSRMIVYVILINKISKLKFCIVLLDDLGREEGGGGKDKSRNFTQ